MAGATAHASTLKWGGRVMASTTQTHQPAGEGPKQGRGPIVPSQQPLLRRFYLAMLKCRMVGERITLLVREGKLAGDWVSDASLGMEAILAGVAMRLGSRDLVAPGKRSFMADVARGAPLHALLRRIGSTGADSEEAGSAALDLARSGRKNSVVVTFLDGGEAGLAGCQKAVQAAGAGKLPILFVVENGSPVQEPKPAARKKNGALLSETPVITVDGTDVVAVARVARESLRCARAGYGPTVMECKVGAALQALSGARPGELPDLDPIRAAEECLAREGLWSEAWKREARESLESEIEHAVATAFSSQP